MSPPLPPAPPDEQLAALAGRRNTTAELRAAQDACQRLYERYAGHLLVFLSSRVHRGDLEDVHHEVWVRVWAGLDGRFDGGHFRGWLYTVARNAATDHARRRRPEAAGEAAADWIDPRPGLHDGALLDEDRRKRLAECLERLDGQSATIVRARLAGEGYEELCTRLGLTPARGHKLFHVAKARLQNCVNRGEQ
jgi:RNA polymerase sigma-70 factor (ECF subfamily)